MSAAPLPKTDVSPAPEPAAGDADGWALLENLRRKLDDQASQGRKTQQQVSQLADSIGALVDMQRRRTRSLNLNSFVAYLIFTVLCGTGFYLLYTTRANELVAARETAKRERDLAVRRADDAATKAAARDRADAAAWDVYQLLEAGKRSDATSKLASLSELPLSRTERAVLAARAHETQVMEVEAALKAAAASFKAGRHGDVIAPLEAALVSETSGPRSASLRYYLGIAYAKTGQLDKAITQLEPALAAESERDDVRFHLASALDRSGAYAKARVEYDRFATAHPQSPLAVFAMRRSATLARMPATAPPKAAPAGAVPQPAAPRASPKPGVPPAARPRPAGSAGSAAPVNAPASAPLDAPGAAPAGTVPQSPGTPTPAGSHPPPTP